MSESGERSPVDDFPLRKALSQGFRLGLPRTISAGRAGAESDRWRIAFLRSGGPRDPVHALWAREAEREWIVADPRHLAGADEADLPQAERDRRERMREMGSGITSYSADRGLRRAVFVLAGRLWLADLAPDGPDPVCLATPGAVSDAHLDPTGRRVSFVQDRALWVMDLTETDTGMPTGPARALCRPTSDTESWGMAEFIAAEEMGRYRGHWWSRDGEHLLVARVEESPVATWWIGDPAHPDREPRPIRYPAAGTANAKVDLWLIGAGPGESRPARQIEWDTERFEYLASVRWDRHGALVSVQSRDQRTVSHLAIDLTDEGAVSVTRVAEVTDPVWVELEPGGPRRDHGGRLVAVAADPATDSTRVRAGEDWLSPPDWQVRSVLDLDDEGVWVHASRDPAENHVCRITWEGVLTPLTTGSAWHTAHCVRPVRVITTHRADTDEVVCRIDGPDAAQQNTVLAGAAEPPAVPITTELLPADGAVRVAVTLPAMPGPRPVIVSSYAGPHAQRVICAARSFATERWFAALGYVVVTIDGRGVPGVAPSVERAVHGDLSTALDDQVAGLRMAADAFPGRLDTGRVGIRGWSFGGYLAALAVLRRPDVFHAGLAGAPVTDWALYDTHYTERYLGTPRDHPRAYRVSSIVDEAASLTRPLLLVHGIADDNVVAAHTLRLSTALLAAGRPHEVLPLVGVTHMTPQAAVNENLLRAEVAYFERALAYPA